METDLLFSCGVDKVSEAEIVVEVEALNYLIDLLIVGIMVADRKSRTCPAPKNAPQGAVDNDLLDLLIKHQLSVRNATEFVVEFLVRDAIHTSLHTNFFEGGFFFGVGSEPLSKNLECIMGELVASGGFLFFFIFYFSFIFIYFFILFYFNFVS